VQDKRIYIGPEIGDQERHPVHHEAADEVHVAAEAIKLGDSEMTFVLLRVRQCGSELGTPVEGIVALAGVYLDKLINDVEVLGFGKVDQRRPLRIETET
jgi:hypothetical protein